MVLGKLSRLHPMLSVNEKTFNETVLDSPKPVLVYFWTPWCGLCRFVNPLLAKLQSDWGDHLMVVNVNADSNFQLATIYRLKNLPTLLLFDQGQVIQRLEEFKAREDLHRILTVIPSQLPVQSA
jgi:thioredoxin 1